MLARGPLVHHDVTRAHQHRMPSVVTSQHPKLARVSLRVLLALLALALAACARPLPPEAPQLAAGASWQYEVHVGEGARTLWVRALFPSGSLPDLAFEHGAERFVSELEVWEAGRWRR